MVLEAPRQVSPPGGDAEFVGEDRENAPRERLVERGLVEGELELERLRLGRDGLGREDADNGDGGDQSLDSEVLRLFARRFVEQDWPAGFPLPEIYYDPRSLATEAAKRSSLHAKCVVVDRRVAFVTSANFTEAAQERNIEAGVVVRSPRFAARLADQFGALADVGLLKRLTLPDTVPAASG